MVDAVIVLWFSPNRALRCYSRADVTGGAPEEEEDRLRRWWGYITFMAAGSVLKLEGSE